MNSSELDRIGKLMEAGAVPEWVRSYVERNRDQMIAKLKRGESVSVTGPSGEKLVIAPSTERSAA